MVVRIGQHSVDLLGSHPTFLPITKEARANLLILKIPQGLDLLPHHVLIFLHVALNILLYGFNFGLIIVPVARLGCLGRLIRVIDMPQLHSGPRIVIRVIPLGSHALSLLIAQLSVGAIVGFILFLDLLEERILLVTKLELLSVLLRLLEVIFVELKRVTQIFLLL